LADAGKVSALIGTVKSANDWRRRRDSGPIAGNRI